MAYFTRLGFFDRATHEGGALAAVAFCLAGKLAGCRATLLEGLADCHLDLLGRRARTGSVRIALDGVLTRMP